MNRVCCTHLADPEFLTVTPFFLRLLELVLAVEEAGFLVGRPGCGAAVAGGGSGGDWG